MGSAVSAAAASDGGGTKKRAICICHSTQPLALGLSQELRRFLATAAGQSGSDDDFASIENSLVIITEIFPRDTQARADVLGKVDVAVLAIDSNFQQSATLIETVSFLKDNRKQVVGGPLAPHYRPSGGIGAVCLALGTWEPGLFVPHQIQTSWTSATNNFEFLALSEVTEVLEKARSDEEMDELIIEEQQLLNSTMELTKESKANSVMIVFTGRNGKLVADKFATLQSQGQKCDGPVTLCSQEEDVNEDLKVLAKARVAVFVITDECMTSAQTPYHRLFEAATRWRKPILPINASKLRMHGWLAMVMAGKLWYQVDLDDLDQIYTKYSDIPGCACKVKDSCLATDFLSCLNGVLASPQRILEAAQNESREAAILQAAKEKAQVMGLHSDTVDELCRKVQDLVSAEGSVNSNASALEALGIALGSFSLESSYRLQAAAVPLPHTLLPEKPENGLKLIPLHYTVTRGSFSAPPPVLDEHGMPLPGLMLDAMFSYQWNSQTTVLDVHEQGRVQNLRAWFDVFGHMQGNVNSAMATAVENVACVVVFLTADYIKSINCKLEFQYAATCRKPMIFVFLEDPRQLDLPSWVTDVVGTTEFNVYPSLIREVDGGTKSRVLALDFNCEEINGAAVTVVLCGAIRRLAATRHNRPPPIVYDGSFLLYATTSALHHAVIQVQDSHSEGPTDGNTVQATVSKEKILCTRCSIAFDPAIASTLDGCRAHSAYYMGGTLLAGRWVCCQELKRDGPGCQPAQHIATERTWTQDPSYGTNTWQPA